MPKKIEKVQVIILQPVAVKGTHYEPGNKPISVNPADARMLIARGKAKSAPAKTERQAD
jgi:hypothetical protein